MGCWLTVIGIGEDGLDGLGQAARNAIAEAQAIFGGKRHLAFLGNDTEAERIAWPSPFDEAFAAIHARRGRPIVVLASGDPMFFGVGASLAKHFSPDEMLVLPYPSSLSLAAARMGWALQDVQTVSVHGRPFELLVPHILPGVRLLVLSNDGTTPARVATLLAAIGFGQSVLTVLEHLGGPKERTLHGTAANWLHERCADLHVLAIACIAAPDAAVLSPVVGLPDEAFENDGQLTKRDIRAVTLSRLQPLPHQLLWDVGAGCGSIGIEWMRVHASCRAIAIEADEGRQGMIERNRVALGVPGLQLVQGRAPSALRGLEAPDAIFIGGGVTDEGVLEACWNALKPGGRLVANAVTLQSEMRLFAWRQEFGGDLTRVGVAQAGELGSFDVWRQALPVTIYCGFK
ncbi:precorrin-6y C5,15-methyltransferase (decarboxylating), CbiE subunit [Brucella melitensis F2/06-6]|uniref:bifunctional cobalt-precorrin-7 (C(5))-methyltransferase/cobalt-precorrin-6B (C(15))-methyltransferase n=1 Tax=Brucella melitensis TaxID=29459 RepID=UPI0002D06B92|nr:bifunctional cobalt-precorrin-7 (C(5))-methyltransferase/cobalt-precorrin-6B (C(15))-methyltransferase [Brucella melitensis]ENQ83040.1 precorrin-6y C5,15-methyltransferase (decarboxylating), CbiE subunit [Brucella melitensis F2/06-6]